MSPPVSVIIPAFNEEQYIGRVLKTLSQQTFKNFEIIVVDNNSTDSTASIARSFGARVVQEMVQGMIPARERGFTEAKAEIILRTDADTIVPRDWVETFYKTFQNHPEIVAAAGNLHIPIIFGPQIIYAYNFLCRILLGHPQLNGPNMAIRKSVWKTITVCRSDKKVHEDIDLSIHMGEKGEIVLLPNLYIKYSMRRFNKSFLFTLIEYSFRLFTTISFHKKNRINSLDS